MDDEQEDFYYGEPMQGGGFAHLLKLGPHQVMVLHRKIYRPYDETPVKGPFGMNPKLAKMLAKQGLGLFFAAAIGYAIKLEKKIEAQIDEHYAPPKVEETEED